MKLYQTDIKGLCTDKGQLLFRTAIFKQYIAATDQNENRLPARNYGVNCCDKF